MNIVFLFNFLTLQLYMHIVYLKKKELGSYTFIRKDYDDRDLSPTQRREQKADRSVTPPTGCDVRILRFFFILFSFPDLTCSNLFANCNWPDWEGKNEN